MKCAVHFTNKTPRGWDLKKILRRALTWTFPKWNSMLFSSHSSLWNWISIGWRVFSPGAFLINARIILQKVESAQGKSVPPIGVSSPRQDVQVDCYTYNAHIVFANRTQMAL